MINATELRAALGDALLEVLRETGTFHAARASVELERMAPDEYDRVLWRVVERLLDRPVDPVAESCE